jgi:cytochrome b subunit of formate dehydrogenase
MISFPVLVYSGFALTYPDTWWAWPLTQMGPEFRGWLHRVAAVVIMLALVLHVLHLIVSPKARACIWLMVPRWADLRELIERFRYYLGLRKEPVHSPPVGYIEKIEYLAFWWGMFVMTVTGLLLWFENYMLRELPAWTPAAMTAIHFYEAILATLSILIWHMYWTVFDPAVYPMDLSWLTGKAPASREHERSEADASDDGKRPEDRRS